MDWNRGWGLVMWIRGGLGADKSQWGPIHLIWEIRVDRYTESHITHLPTPAIPNPHFQTAKSRTVYSHQNFNLKVIKCPSEGSNSQDAWPYCVTTSITLQLLPVFYAYFSWISRRLAHEAHSKCVLSGDSLERISCLDILVFTQLCNGQIFAAGYSAFVYNPIRDHDISNLYPPQERTRAVRRIVWMNVTVKNLWTILL